MKVHEQHKHIKTRNWKVCRTNVQEKYITFTRDRI